MLVPEVPLVSVVSILVPATVVAVLAGVVGMEIG